MLGAERELKGLCEQLLAFAQKPRPASFRLLMSLMSPRIAGRPSKVIATFTISAGMTAPDCETKRTSIAGPAVPVCASR